MKIKTIHIHTSKSFMNDAKRFEGGNFENTNIIITNSTNKNNLKKQFLQFDRSRESIQKIIDICKEAELVVLYDLDKIKTKIALNLPRRIKIAWRFFGHELYDCQRHLYLSNTTKKTLGVKIIFEKIWENQNKTFLAKAFNRINFFLGLSDTEYHYLVKYFPDLPEFVQFPVSSDHQNFETPDFSLKRNRNKPLIILGNNKGLYNNHIDIINLIEKNPNKSNYEFMLFFNYGLEKIYTKKIRKLIIDKNYFTLVEKFLSLQEFHSIYETAGSLIINAYRQIALANIFTALKNGTKVYLNKRNLILSWLKKEGFLIYNIEQLDEDLHNNDLVLNDKQALHNLTQINNLIEKFSYKDFQKELYVKCISD